MDILDMPTPWALTHEIGDIISSAPGENFYVTVFSFLSKYIPFSNGHILKYRDNGAPLVLHDGRPNVYEWTDEYLSGYYLLDPLWLYLKNHENGDEIYRLDTLAPDSFTQSSYFKKHYRKAQITDELGWIIGSGQDRIVICLLKRWDSGQFNEEQIRIAQVLQPIFSSVVKLHETLMSQVQLSANHNWDGTTDHESPSARINAYLLATGNDKKTLSDRQTDIVDLILRGHSTESIGLNLSISAGTVKTHKRNIYSRLGISSHGELFNLFVKSLGRD
ncbi:helix-turn-helix transcriptional regulator [Agrobacterium sp. NPDC090283]|uniref:helix-turn-helix transcriptional regulator n=1 Tax=Agrobacterium sp. NPDC090283 TaxID=3363920 RepID=UPI003839E0F1